MIPYKDLTMGNYVKVHTGEYYYVDYINYDCVGLVNSYNFNEHIMCDKIYPIEVTHDLLIKIGFEFSSKGSVVKKGVYHQKLNECLLSVIELNDGGYCFDSYSENIKSNGSFHFQYLHELQNAIKLVTKQELEIDL